MEIIKNIICRANTFEIRSGKALTIIELLSNNKPTGREITFKTDTEIKDLRDKLTEILEFWEKEKL